MVIFGELVDQRELSCKVELGMGLDQWRHVTLIFHFCPKPEAPQPPVASIRLYNTILDPLYTLFRYFKRKLEIIVEAWLKQYQSIGPPNMNHFLYILIHILHGFFYLMI